MGCFWPNCLVCRGSKWCCRLACQAGYLVAQLADGCSHITAGARGGAAGLPSLPDWVDRDHVGQATIIGTEETTAQVPARVGEDLSKWLPCEARHAQHA